MSIRHFEASVLGCPVKMLQAGELSHGHAHLKWFLDTHVSVGEVAETFQYGIGDLVAHGNEQEAFVAFDMFTGDHTNFKFLDGDLFDFDFCGFSLKGVKAVKYFGVIFFLAFA